MRSIKAIVAGSLFIAAVFILLQLAYVFIAVGYNSLAASYPFLKEIAGIFRYLIGFPLFVMTMFVGGYITASVANIRNSLKMWLHCFTVGFITIGIMMYSALENSSLTITGIVVIVLALSASSAGGFYWLRGNKDAGENKI